MSARMGGDGLKLYGSRHRLSLSSLCGGANMHSLDDLLTSEQASEVLNVRLGTLQSWRCTGRGPAYIRVGKVVRYSRKALSEYINAHTHIPAVTAMRAGSQPETRDERLARLRSQRAFIDQLGRKLDLANPQRVKRRLRQSTKKIK
jgi:hypothetical protein